MGPRYRFSIGTGYPEEKWPGKLGQKWGKTSNSSWMGHSVELGSWNLVQMGQKNTLNSNPSSVCSQIGVFGLFWGIRIFQKKKNVFFSNIFHISCKIEAPLLHVSANTGFCNGCSVMDGPTLRAPITVPNMKGLLQHDKGSSFESVYFVSAHRCIDRIENQVHFSCFGRFSLLKKKTEVIFLPTIASGSFCAYLDFFW